MYIYIYIYTYIYYHSIVCSGGKLRPASRAARDLALRILYYLICILYKCYIIVCIYIYIYILQHMYII